MFADSQFYIWHNNYIVTKNYQGLKQTDIMKTLQLNKGNCNNSNKRHCYKGFEEVPTFHCHNDEKFVWKMKFNVKFWLKINVSILILWHIHDNKIFIRLFEPAGLYQFNMFIIWKLIKLKQTIFSQPTSKNISQIKNGNDRPKGTTSFPPTDISPF